MRKLMMGAISAAAIAIAGPAAAQVHIDAPGVGVHVGSGDQHHRGYRARAQDSYRARAQGNCREVTTRTVRPNGTVVIKKQTRCR
jgi:hypothetical protein